MLDPYALVQLDKQLQIIANNSSIIYGGFNILFLGDFLQFPSVSQRDLYVNPDPTPRSYVRGHDLWRSLTDVVVLEEQMREADDPTYAALLRRLRIRQLTDDDVALLNSRVGAPLPPFSTPMIITRRHTI